VAQPRREELGIAAVLLKSVDSRQLLATVEKALDAPREPQSRAGPS
jgi:hypothetical protein